MSFVAPLIGAALGLGSVGTAVLNIGFAVGAVALSRSLAPKSGKSQQQRGQNLTMRIEANAPRQAIFGRAPNAGSLVYWQCTGTNNETLHMVIALADHECEGLAELWVDGKKRSWNAVTGVVGGYNGKLKVRFYRGNADQTADVAVRDASGGRWTNNERGIGVCYAVVEATEDEEVFKSGIPQIVFVIDGAKLYDRRKDSTVGGSGPQRRNDPSTWVYTRNNAVVIDNVLGEVLQNGAYLMGLRAPADTVRVSDFEASANVCDELVMRGDGETEKRYECGFVVDIGPGLFPEQDALELAIEGMAGDVITTGGIYRILAGAAQPIVATLSDEDFVVDAPFVRSDFRPRTELTNAITAEFSNPARAYQAAPLPIRKSSVDEAADGGARWVRSLDLKGVFSNTQGQRVMEIRRKEARRQGRGQATLIEKWFILEAGDWVAINSGRAGWLSRTFKIGASSETEGLTSERAFIETDAEIDDWDSSMEIEEDEVADLPGGGPTLTQIAGWDVDAVAVSGVGGQQFPALLFVWTPITDRTVTAVRIDYRKVGDTTFQTAYALDPGAGQYLCAAGIQGEVVWEARAVGITTPLRGFTYTAWINTVTAAPQQIVGRATEADNVPDGAITPPKLDEYTRRTIELMVAKSIVQGSLAAFKQQAQEDIARLSEAVLDLQSQAISQNAYIQRREIIQQSENAAFAEAIQLVGTQLGALSANVAVVQGSVNGIKAYYGVLLDVNGRFGFFKMDGTGDEVTAVFGVDRFQIMGTGTDPTAPFTVITEEGEEVVIIDAPLYGTGSITGDKLSANTIDGTKIVAGVELVAPLVRNETNTSYWNLNTGDFQIG